MTSEQLAKMQAGRRIALAAAAARLASAAEIEHAQWERLHKQAAEDHRQEQDHAQAKG